MPGNSSEKLVPSVANVASAPLFLDQQLPTSTVVSIYIPMMP